jgi:hypothetical protein
VDEGLYLWLLWLWTGDHMMLLRVPRHDVFFQVEHS